MLLQLPGTAPARQSPLVLVSRSIDIAPFTISSCFPSPPWHPTTFIIPSSRIVHLSASPSIDFVWLASLKSCPRISRVACLLRLLCSGTQCVVYSSIPSFRCEDASPLSLSVDICLRKLPVCLDWIAALPVSLSMKLSSSIFAARISRFLTISWITGGVTTSDREGQEDDEFMDDVICITILGRVCPYRLFQREHRT